MNYTWTDDRQPDLVTATTQSGGGKTTHIKTVYNTYGLPTTVSIYENLSDIRSVTSSYSDVGDSPIEEGYFVYTVTNDLGHTVTTKVDPAHGQPIEVIDINNLVSNSQYDAFGRVEQVTPPVGTGQPAYSRLVNCAEGSCDSDVSGSNVAYKVTTYQAGAPETTLQ